MRITLLTPGLDPGYGWARYGLDLARALSDQGVEIVAITQPGAQIPADASWLADVRPVLPQLMPPAGNFLVRSLLALPRVRRAVTACDLLHVVAEPYAPLAALVAGSRPLVVTAHGTYVPQTVRRRLVGYLYHWAYHRAHLIAVSHYTAGQVRAALPNARLTVIHNGVHVSQFQRSVPMPEKRGLTVLASGGVKARKGTHLLVAALALVREQVPDVQLIVTGRQDSPAYLAEIEQQITALGLTDHVHLLGLIAEDKLLGWYQNADLFVLPALNVGDKFEGFGLVFLEAGACGLPVIGTTGSGVEEAVIDGETGLLVPQNDVSALADAILRLLHDDTLRERIGAAGRKHAQDQDWSAVAARVLALYKQILA
jgi:phosphatidylinositol alpha-1,6-mannosyltransferase